MSLHPVLARAHSALLPAVAPFSLAASLGAMSGFRPSAGAAPGAAPEHAAPEQAPEHAAPEQAAEQAAAEQAAAEQAAA